MCCQRSQRSSFKRTESTHLTSSLSAFCSMYRNKQLPRHSLLKTKAYVWMFLLAILERLEEEAITCVTGCDQYDGYRGMQSNFRTHQVKNCIGQLICANIFHGCQLVGPIVLQIVSVTNITQPSRRQAEDSQPRVLQVRLTDGHVKCVGIEREQINSIRWFRSFRTFVLNVCS